MRTSPLLLFCAALALPGCGSSASSNTETNRQPTLAEWMEDLKSDSEKKRWDTAWALGQKGPEARQMVNALIAVLQYDRSPSVKAQAALSLVHIDPKGEECVPALTAALRVEGEDVTVLTKVAESLSILGPPAEPAVPELMLLLKHLHRGVRLQAVSALGSVGVGAEDALPELRLLADGDADAVVREAALESLKKIQAK
jgi:HEAT repeat protein